MKAHPSDAEVHQPALLLLAGFSSTDAGRAALCHRASDVFSALCDSLKLNVDPQVHLPGCVLLRSLMRSAEHLPRIPALLSLAEGVLELNQNDPAICLQSIAAIRNMLAHLPLAEVPSLPDTVSLLLSAAKRHLTHGELVTHALFAITRLATESEALETILDPVSYTHLTLPTICSG